MGMNNNGKFVNKSNKKIINKIIFIFQIYYF
jgi:hypothetical protein